MSKIKLGAAALALLASTALPVETPIGGDLFGAPAAQAGVWGKVKGAAKKVGGTGKYVGKSVGGMAKEAGKLGWEGVKGYGHIVGGGTGAAVTSVGKGAKAAWNGLDRGLGAIQEKIHDKYTPKPAPLVGKPLPKPSAGKPGSWGGQTSN